MVYLPLSKKRLINNFKNWAHYSFGNKVGCKIWSCIYAFIHVPFHKKQKLTRVKPALSLNQNCQVLCCGLKKPRVKLKSSTENPVMTFPIKKRVNTELFIYRMAALYIAESWVRDMTNEGNQCIGTSWLQEQANLAQKCFLGLRGMGMKDQVSNLSRNEFNRNLIKLEHFR